MPTRRRLLQATVSALAAPSIARAGSGAQVLKVVPQADLGSLDPVWTTTYQTRDHGFMVFDTLFGLDSASFRRQPQMAEGAASEQEASLAHHVAPRPDVPRRQQGARP